MANHIATIRWSRDGRSFLDNQHSRVHRWEFDGGATVAAASSPHVVKVPLTDPACVDPEEAYVAALASCHMLWFLSLAAYAGFQVDRYVDRAEGTLSRNEAGKEAITRVTLRPAIEFSRTKQPTDAEVDALHHRAHDSCYLANSVKTEIVVDGSWHYA